MTDLVPERFSLDIAKQVNKKDAQIANLESRLSREIDQRKEERFYWIFFAVIVIDMFAFNFIDHLYGVLAIVVLELIVLASLARRLGVDHYEETVDKLLSAFSSLSSSISNGKKN